MSTPRHRATVSRPPSLLWRIRYARLVIARLIDKLGPRQVSKAVGLLSIALAINLTATAHEVVAPGAPKQAIAAWVVQLIILAVSALVSWALAPKPKEPERVKANAPVVEDGKGIVIICGTVWIEDEMVLAFKEVGTKKIKASGGKKG